MTDFEDFARAVPEGRAAVSLMGRVVSRYITLTERSQTTRTIVYGVTAFGVMFGLDLMLHFAGWSWLREQLICDILEAIILATIASYLSRLREERIFRRKREIRYLNHHIRNALSLIQMAQQQLTDTRQRADAVDKASRRICTVLEQLSRDEDLHIDEKSPENYEKAG